MVNTNNKFIGETIIVFLDAFSNIFFPENLFHPFLCCLFSFGLLYLLTGWSDGWLAGRMNAYTIYIVIYWFNGFIRDNMQIDSY